MGIKQKRWFQTTVLANWRTANPLGTATEFAVALRNFTS